MNSSDPCPVDKTWDSMLQYCKLEVTGTFFLKQRKCFLLRLLGAQQCCWKRRARNSPRDLSDFRDVTANDRWKKILNV
jgi:hypothetical protein